MTKHTHRVHTTVTTYIDGFKIVKKYCKCGKQLGYMKVPYVKKEA